MGVIVNELSPSILDGVQLSSASPENARANSPLVVGGDVSAVITERAGPKLREALAVAPSVGQSRILVTKGYKLKCKELYHVAISRTEDPFTEQVRYLHCILPHTA